MRHVIVMFTMWASHQFIVTGTALLPHAPALLVPFSSTD